MPMIRSESLAGRTERASVGEGAGDRQPVEGVTPTHAGSVLLRENNAPSIRQGRGHADCFVLCVFMMKKLSKIICQEIDMIQTDKLCPLCFVSGPVFDEMNEYKIRPSNKKFR